MAAVLLAAAPAIPATISYEYDNLGRVKAVIHDDGTRTDYAYDAAGNRTTVSTTGPTGTLQLTAASGNVNENVSSITITVSRTGGSNGAAAVNYGTSNGTATSGSSNDYTATSGTLNWTNGDAANKTFNVPILDDSTFEGNETFTVTLSGATGATLGGPSVATITINDNEVAPSGTLSLQSTSYTVLEAATNVTVTVTRTGGTNGAVSVQYATSNGTATSGAGNDYTATSGTLNWANGDSANKTFAVPILDDSTGEPAETINLTLSSPGGGATLGTSSGTITINDNETGTLALSSSTYSIAENGTSLTVNVARTGGSYGAASVNYGTTAGTATATSDYTTTSGTLNWTSGDAASKSFAIPIVNNSAFESSEDFTVTISGQTGAALGSPSSATVTINDDDPPVPGTLSLSPSSYSIGEGGSSINVTVTRSGGSDGAVGVQYATSNGTATVASDYTTASGSLSWNNGDTASKSLSVPILEDSTGEPAETINLTLSNVTGGASIGTSTGTITINDNEPGALQFTSSTFSVNEPNTPVTITVSRTNGSAGAVSVTYATANGTATSGSDYTAASGTLNWSDGDAANKSFNVTISNDSSFEGNETFTASVSSPGGGATLGSPTSTTVTIVDEDGPGVPTNVSAPGSAPTGSFTLSWTASTGSINHYTIEEYRTFPSPAGPTYYTTASTSYGFTKGTAEREWTYRVRGCSSSDDSVCSAYSSPLVEVSTGGTP